MEIINLACNYQRQLTMKKYKCTTYYYTLITMVSNSTTT